ncbi:MAG: hypothetical protein PHZ07_00725 [Patescibacteria group bacterium]|nr:hypothetical protein [Patescibacteria group bacterium]MDD4304793.1 hypothetical protein [Patescibacteria group bacterium]MDD4695278.1 hypothetical protein [Patescibacteria group bacterium]
MNYISNKFEGGSMDSIDLMPDDQLEIDLLIDKDGKSKEASVFIENIEIFDKDKTKAKEDQQEIFELIEKHQEFPTVDSINDVINDDVSEINQKNDKKPKEYLFTFRRDDGHGHVEECTVVAVNNKQAKWKARNLLQPKDNTIGIWDDRVVECKPVPVNLSHLKHGKKIDQNFQDYKNSSYYKAYQE